MFYFISYSRFPVCMLTLLDPLVTWSTLLILKGDLLRYPNQQLALHHWFWVGLKISDVQILDIDLTKVPLARGCKIISTLIKLGKTLFWKKVLKLVVKKVVSVTGIYCWRIIIHSTDKGVHRGSRKMKIYKTDGLLVYTCNQIL